MAFDYAELHEFLNANPERQVVLEWLMQEANAYSNEKWFARHNKEAKGPGEDHDLFMRDQGFDKDGFWFGQVFQYADRANLYGVGQDGSGVSERGRQALMKMLMTLFDCAACMIRVHGLPPEPGHSSSDDLEEWARVAP